MKIYSKILLLLLSLAIAQVALAHTVNLTKFRFTKDSSKTRLVFDSSGQIKYTAVDFPKKIIVDIQNTKLGCKLKADGIDKTAIESISNIQNKNELRLVIRLKKRIKLEHFILKNPNRLVLDLYSLDEPKAKQKSKETTKKTTATIISAKNKLSKDDDKQKFEELMGGLVGTKVATLEPVLESNEEVTKSKPDKIYHRVEEHDKGLREVIIVIDPGHGGNDPGAIGRRGTLEKDVTLAVAKHLYKIINKTKGFRAFLTRKDDYFVTLRQRLDIAHKHNADLFISIHADAYKHDRAYGASVFALSQRGATSEAARWLAKKENESELAQAILDKNMMLRSVLIDLAQTATISSSLEVGGLMLKRLSSIARLHSKYIEQAAFVVLKSPDIPSLLVELGFLSHKFEEKLLCSSRYQRKLADNLAIGIKYYFMKRPPHGTYLAKLKLR